MANPISSLAAGWCRGIIPIPRAATSCATTAATAPTSPPRSVPILSTLRRARRGTSAAISRSLCSRAYVRRDIPPILRLLMNYVDLSTNLASRFFELVIGKIPTSRLSLSKHLAHNLGNLLLLGKIGVFHNRRNASSRLLLLISKHLILCIYLVFRILA